MMNLTFWIVVCFVSITTFLACAGLQSSGFAMRWRLTKENVKLETLISVVEDFFAGRGFREGEASSDNRKRQMEFEARREGRLRSVKVTIYNIRNGFEIEFAFADTQESLAKLSALTTPYVGGLFVRDRLKYAAPGFFERLEADFWDFVEIKVRSEGKDTKA